MTDNKQNSEPEYEEEEIDIGDPIPYPEHVKKGEWFKATYEGKDITFKLWDAPFVTGTEQITEKEDGNVVEWMLIDTIPRNEHNTCVKLLSGKKTGWTVLFHHMTVHKLEDTIQKEKEETEK